jgi:putative aldouronate transport system permease protein
MMKPAVRGRRKEQRVEFLLIFFFVCVCVICLIPILNIIAISLSGKNATLSGKVFLVPIDFSLASYQRILADTGFMYSFYYSTILTLGYTMIAMCLTILCAYPLSRKELPGGRVIVVCIIFTIYFVPGIIPAYLNIRNLMLLDTVWSLVLPGALSAYNMIILRSFFRSIDASLFEAAYIDGASEYRTLLTIAIPLALPSIATLSLFYAVGRWNNINDVLFYTTNPALYTVQLRLKQMMDMIVISQEEGGGGANVLTA